jgi:hypothetical protein
MATNKKAERGNPIYVPVASGVKANDVCLAGTVALGLTGVALTDRDSANSASVDVEGVYAVSVAAVNGGGNSAVAVGDPIYYVDADTPKLSKKTAGVLFGFALETIGSGSTATINVLQKKAVS